ncbi:hypothetical protein EI171_08310 [Bradyrhizobium sp. LCT2]|uniref:hypothetical protein n=1 Tax=Bradyrhizobium sp. LCT2 TaxID=2493093 RepID=UPI0013739344|nr:hypothetical protein [Bradyrhizobium sp. LCT2]QHP67430.1 hypothetical protein EI171_08310 [Bradyrhizobium sp. LCT2]
MPIAEDRCLTCGTRYRPGNLDTSVSSCEAIDPDGTFFGMPYWFCSVDCYKKAVSKYIKDKRYGFDKTPGDDEACQAAIKDAYAELMVEMSGGLIANLFNRKLRMSESEFIQAHIKPTVDTFYSLQSDQIFNAEIELQQHLNAEWMHQIDQDIAQRENERAKLHEQFDKDWQKLKQKKAKEEAEQEAKRQEEERWQPKPFKL